MLGTELTDCLTRNNLRVNGFDLPELDITNPAALEEALADADAIVNCAAYTNVDGAEADPGLAQAVNADAVGQLGHLAARNGQYVVHIGTDFVYDGAQEGSYTEGDQTIPINTYGRSKLEGEQLLRASGCRHCVLRLQWTYGRAGPNFIDKVLERARNGAELCVVDDQFGAPTWTREAASVIATAVTTRLEGLYLYAAAGYASRFEIAAFALSAAGMTNKLTACRTSDFVAPATRPLNSRFDCAAIDAVLGVPRRDWRAPLREYLAEQAQ